MPVLDHLARDEWLRGVVDGGTAYALPMVAEAELAAYQEVIGELGSHEEWPEQPPDPDEVTGRVETLFRAMSAAASSGRDVVAQCYAQGWLHGYQALRSAYQESMVTEPWLQLVRRRAVPNGGRRRI